MEPSYDTMLWRQDAVDRVLSVRSEALADRSTVSVPLRSVPGHALAAPITAPVTSPDRNYATMDGYAFDATDEYPLTLLDRQVFPEDDPDPIDSGEAVRIATGAPLPEGADVVLKREDATLEGDDLRGVDLAPGTYTYERGSNMSTGETLFDRGEVLSSRDAILLGDIGTDPVEVYDPFSVGFLATGTEIHEGRHPDLDSPMLASLVERWGHDAGPIDSVPDELERVEDAIASFADRHDVVITTGGTSVGKKDHVIQALDALGEIRFHSVRVRPGKPIAVAELPDHDAVAFAIPGKPVGAYTIAVLVARAFFTGERTPPGRPLEVDRSVSIGKEGFEYSIPVSIDGDRARPYGHVDSPLEVYDDVFDPSVLSSTTRATRADGFFITESGVEAGDTVSVVRYSQLE